MNKEELLETQPTKDLEVNEEVTEIIEKTQKENIADSIWIKMIECDMNKGFQKMSQVEIDEFKDFNRRYEANKVKPPLGLSQRLNMSG